MDKEINMEQVNGRVLAQQTNEEINFEVINGMIEYLSNTGRQSDASFLRKTIDGEVIKTYGLTAYVKLARTFNEENSIMDLYDFHIIVGSNTNESFGFTYRTYDLPGFFSRDLFRKVIFTMAYSCAKLKYWSDMACEREGYYHNLLHYNMIPNGKIIFDNAGDVIFWTKLEAEEAA